MSAIVVKAFTVCQGLSKQQLIRTHSVLGQKRKDTINSTA